MSDITKILLQAFVFNVLGGLGIFLLGMKLMSEGMQAVAGNRLRQLISAVTNNKLIACGIGTAITCLIQSSSVTTVMVVGFVNGGFMTLMQAIGVILGANIGTTITGWILVLNIGKYGLPLIGISSFVYLFAKNERASYTAMAIVGIGMVFFGLETMSEGFKNPDVKQVLAHFFASMTGATYFGVLKCAVTGCIATMIVQSSSATLGVTIALAKSGIIEFEAAAALIMGLNIGTTITAFLASLGASTNAKRAAYAHIIFNIVGSVWLFPIFYQYIALIKHIIAGYTHLCGFFSGNSAAPLDITAQIALTHTGFNLINTIVFLPFMGILAKVVSFIVPDKQVEETPHLTFLDVKILDTPAIGIQQSQDEIIRMGEHVTKMLTMLRELITAEKIDPEKEKKLFHREEIMDIVQKEIVEFLSHILTGNISHEVVTAGRQQLRLADEYESISDYIAAILKLFLKMKDSNLQISDEGMQEILTIHHHVTEYIEYINEATKKGMRNILSESHTKGENITHMVKDYRDRHLERVSSKEVSPLNSLIYNDILTSYRKIKDHAQNIAESLAGVK